MALFGRNTQRPEDRAGEPQSPDEQAIERYRYMLRTAPPDTIERAHAEAFAQLTPEQRRQVLQKMAEGMPESERAALEQGNASPQALARMATRAEIRQPGAMERMFGQGGASLGGPSLGGLVGSSLLGSLAGTVLGSVIAREFFAHEGHAAAGLDSTGDSGQDAEPLADAGDGTDDGDSLDTGGIDDV